MATDHDVNERARGESSAVPPAGGMPASDGAKPDAPRVVHRDGVAYIEGCDVAIWRLEMNRRAGSPSSAQIKVAPGLTPAGLDLAFAYADQHAGEMDAAIRELGLDEVPVEEEEDDEGEIQADMDEMFKTYNEVFRRLAQ
jgi:hypothetical protein